VTLPTSRKLLAAMVSAFPQAILVQAVTDANYTMRALEKVQATAVPAQVWLIDGASNVADVPISPKDWVLPKVGQLQMVISCDLWSHPEPRYSNFVLDRASKDLGRPIFRAGVRGLPEKESIAHSTFSVRSTFPSNDGFRRQRLTDVSEELLTRLPDTSLERVDLVSGQVVGRARSRLDPMLADWCGKSRDRWLWVSRDMKDGPWIGTRPAKN